MYEELRHPFTVKWAREAGFGAKSLMRLQRAGLMVASDERRPRLRLLDVADERAATTAVGPLVALGRRSAAAWYGWPLLVRPSEIELVVPRSRQPTPWPGARIITQQLLAADVFLIRDVPVTSPLHTAVDLAVQLPIAEALAVLDGACRLGGVRLSALRRELLRMDRPKTRALARLIDPRRASVYESLFFFLMAKAGIATPDCQFVVRRGAVFVARADFAWAHRRLIVEIDGFEFHSDRAAFQSDRTRQNAMVNAGWRVLRFTAADLVVGPDSVVATVRAGLRLPLSAHMIKV